jgi:hypothetical protein
MRLISKVSIRSGSLILNLFEILSVKTQRIDIVIDSFEGFKHIMNKMIGLCRINI